ncbi:MAG: hypothetical protein M3R46_04100 [Actinomycetota bacterium]|nr:hypothetical protein [Actinomycetota bacterium]
MRTSSPDRMPSSDLSSTSGASLAKKAGVVLIVGVAAWLLLKVVIGVVTSFAFAVVGVVALVAVLWAANKLL